MRPFDGGASIREVQMLFDGRSGFKNDDLVRGMVSRELRCVRLKRSLDWRVKTSSITKLDLEYKID